MDLLDADIIWLKQHYPGLTVVRAQSEILVTGEFAFSAAFDEDAREYIINPVTGACDRWICITDSYEIELSLSSTTSSLPSIRETAGRLLATAHRLGRPIEDLHAYENGTLCLVGQFDLARVSTVPDLFDSVVLQFFYDESYFARFGRWPRGQYLHGLLGVIENYIDNLEQGRSGLETECINRVAAGKSDKFFESLMRELRSSERIGSHQPCICGSGRAFRDCHDHQKVFRALWNLKKYLRENNLHLK